MSAATWAEIETAGGRWALTWLRRRDDLAVARQLPILAGVDRLRRPSSISGAETANVAITVDNGKGAANDLLTAAQGATLELYQPDGAGGRQLLFTGIVDRITGGAAATIAAVGADLAAAVPLRPASVLGEFDADERLAWVIGRAVALEPRRFSVDGRQHQIADHPIARIRAVIVDGQVVPVETYLLISEIVDGQAVATLLLSQAPARSVVVIVDGAVDEAGEIIENPADVARWLLDRFGAPITAAEVDAYRIASLGVQLRGVVDGAAASRRELLDTVFRSAGAIWSIGMPGLARRWPPDSADGHISGTLTPLVDTSPAIEALPLLTRLPVRFDYDWSVGQYRRAFVAEAPSAIEVHGVREPDAPLDLPWLADWRTAEDIAAARLGFAARPGFSVRWQAAGINHDPGDVWALSHSASPVSGRQVLTDAALDLTGNTAELTTHAITGLGEPVEIGSRSERLAAGGRSLQVLFGDGELIITATDDAERPVPGAEIILDGRRAVADGAGRAVFRGITPGTYRGVIIAPSGARSPFTVTVRQ